MNVRIAQGFAAFLFFVALVLSQPVAAQQAGNGNQNNGTPPANGNQSPSIRVEKFHVRQEFGPQATARRGDRMTTAAPPNRNNGTHNTGGQGTSGTTYRQDFGPQVHGPRQQPLTTDRPQSNSPTTGGTQRNANRKSRSR